MDHLLSNPISANLKKRRTITERYPYFVKLPKGCKSPTNSIYTRYDIVKQGRVLSTFGNSEYTVRSAEPFTLRILLENGKEKTLESKNGKVK